MQGLVKRIHRKIGYISDLSLSRIHNRLETRYSQLLQTGLDLFNLLQRALYLNSEVLGFEVGTVQLRRDLYGRDEKLDEALSTPPAAA